MIKYEPLGQSGYRDAKREQKIARLQKSLPVLNILLRLAIIGLLIFVTAKGCEYWRGEVDNMRSFERMY